MVDVGLLSSRQSAVKQENDRRLTNVNASLVLETNNALSPSC